jgi:hypothetical protein
MLFCFCRLKSLQLHSQFFVCSGIASAGVASLYSAPRKFVDQTLINVSQEIVL